MERYSFGMGDRFGRQGAAQLRAVLEAKMAGVAITPVWNKSHREHTTIGTEPPSLRREADAAVLALGWRDAYRVDADHINLDNVDGFLTCSDFFTIDVADAIGTSLPISELDDFIGRHPDLIGRLEVPGIEEAFDVSADTMRSTAGAYLGAVKQAGRIYRHIENVKGRGGFITEVSMDETNRPQSPLELLFILAALADEGVPVQTIAPKFSGRFNKGVDYVGNVAQFAKEFEEDVLVIRFAIERFGLPANLKLSVHSGSDKFSLYEPMRRIMRLHGVGMHIKTAGTTWLEELIGLALSGAEGLAIVRGIYREARGRMEALCKPYAEVVDIDAARLPTLTEVDAWNGQAFAAALRHDPDGESYNPSFRQLLHVGYKVAAELGDTYLSALDRHAAIIGEQVTHNLLNRHLCPLFLAP